MEKPAALLLPPLLSSILYGPLWPLLLLPLRFACSSRRWSRACRSMLQALLEQPPRTDSGAQGLPMASEDA